MIHLPTKGLNSSYVKSGKIISLNSRRESISSSKNKRRKTCLGCQRSTRYTGHPPLSDWLVTDSTTSRERTYPTSLKLPTAVPKATTSLRLRRGGPPPNKTELEGRGPRRGRCRGVWLKRRGRAEPQAPPLRDAPGIGAAEAVGPRAAPHALHPRPRPRPAVSPHLSP